MKKLIITLIIILLFTQAQAQSWFGNKSIKGNGNTTIITKSTANYDAIKCAGFMDFILEKGVEGKITIEGEENLLEHITTEVKNNTLVVKIEKHINLQPSRNKSIKITIPFIDVNKVSLAGSGELWNTSSINASNFEVELAGSGEVTLEVYADAIVSSLAGSGDITLEGKTINLETSVAGSGDFNGNNLQAENTEVSVAGSGDAEVISTNTLKARVSGSGDIVYKGKPNKEDSKVAGSGSISSN